MINIRRLEKELWTSADLLRQGSKLTSQEYCMPVLGCYVVIGSSNAVKTSKGDALS